MQQITDTILMVRPAAIRKNEQTKVNNFFQEELDLDLQEAQINERAQEEFDAIDEKLRSVGVNDIVHKDKKENDTTDSIYPKKMQPLTISMKISRLSSISLEILQSIQSKPKIDVERGTKKY